MASGELGRVQWRAAHEGAFVRFGIEGDCDRTSQGSVLAACGAYMSEVGACGLVADYSCARLLMTADDLARNLRRAACQSRTIATPAALLVRPDDLPQWLAYAGSLAQIGVVRGIFTVSEDAHRWAARQAQVHEQELRRMGSREAAR